MFRAKKEKILLFVQVVFFFSYSISLLKWVLSYINAYISLYVAAVIINWVTPWAFLSDLFVIF